MREIRTSGSEGGVRFEPSSLPLSKGTAFMRFDETEIRGMEKNGHAHWPQN